MLRRIRATMTALLVLAGVGLTAPDAGATVILTKIKLLDNLGIEVLASGTIDFAGDLSTDGTFPLVSTDIVAFDLTFPSLGGLTFTKADLAFLATLDYLVVGGALKEIDLVSDPPLNLPGIGCSMCVLRIGNIGTGGTTDPSPGAPWAFVDNADAMPALFGQYVIPGPVPLPILVLGLMALSIAVRGRRPQ
ncbi:MAG: hypothetical protein MI755_06475 [Sphingomonadales bacterium]|nr:hypothetical protein [Sphingomonadales bacterium]